MFPQAYPCTVTVHLIYQVLSFLLPVWSVLASCCSVVFDLYVQCWRLLSSVWLPGVVYSNKARCSQAVLSAEVTPRFERSYRVVRVGHFPGTLRLLSYGFSGAGQFPQRSIFQQSPSIDQDLTPLNVLGAEGGQGCREH